VTFKGLSRLKAFRVVKDTLAHFGTEAAEREAALIISGAISGEVSDVFTGGEKALSGEESRAVQKSLTRRLTGMPLQYAMNAAYFMGLKFHVNRRVLIPRPETEILVQKALEGLKEGQRALDLGTGSGCIAVSLAKDSGAGITASDKYSSALKIDRENARENGVEERIAFIKSDMFQNIEGLFDCIVSNPPYIPDEEYAALDKSVRDYEPAYALKAGDGLKYYRTIALGAKTRLNPGGRLLLEIGYDQTDAVTALLDGNGYRDIRCEKDYAGLNRVITAKV